MILTPDTYQNALGFLHDQRSHVSRIAKKLLNLVGATHFAFIHSQHNIKNSLAGFGINVGVMNYWMEQGMPLPFVLPNGFYLTTCFAALFPSQALETLREKHSTDNILFYVQHNHESTDIFGISGDPDNKSILSNYINHANAMRKFFIYFKQETRELLREAKTNHSIGYDFKPKLQKDLFPCTVVVPNYNGFGSLSDVVDTLSKREFECLKLTGAALSIKSIALKLKLSPRTVESYLLNVKNKLHCQNSHEVLDLYHTLNDIFQEP